MTSLDTKLKKMQNKIIKYSLTLTVAMPLFFGHPEASAQDNDYKPSYTSTKITSSDIPKMTFNDYINMREPRTNDSNVYRIFGLGVGASELPQQYGQGYFNQVVPLATGNTYMDYAKATLDTAKIPVTQLNLNLKDAAGKKIEYWAHSWHASVVMNEIRMGKLNIDKLVLLDPPGARDYSDLTKQGIKVEVYAPEKSGFRLVPETFAEQNKGIRGEPLPGVTAGFKWTKEFGGGLPGLPQPKGIGSTVTQIPTDHYTKSILDNLSKQGILKPLPTQNSFNSSFPKHSLTTGSNFGHLNLPSYKGPNLDNILARPISISQEVRIGKTFNQWGIKNNWSDFGNRGNFVGGYMKPTQIYTQPRINYTTPIVPMPIYTAPRIETYRPPRR